MKSINVFFKKNGFVGAVTMIVIMFAIVVILWNKLILNKNIGNLETMQGAMASQHRNKKNPSNNPAPYQESGNMDGPGSMAITAASVDDYNSTLGRMPSQSSSSYNQNPQDLLPANSSEWGQLNPQGNGELSNINLLKAGFTHGVDTVGSSLRNPNYQLRSEPPNPQVNVGPWNNSTITPDLMRPPLEIGSSNGFQ